MLREVDQRTDREERADRDDERQADRDVQQRLACRRAAGNNERAIEHFVSAAEQAERGWAKDHAVMLYREALELVPEEDAAGRRALRRRLAVASQALFHVPDVRGLP